MQVIIGPGDLVDMRQPKRECLDAIHRAKREFGDTDIYDIYEDVCRSDSSCAPGRQALMVLAAAPGASGGRRAPLGRSSQSEERAPRSPGQFGVMLRRVHEPALLAAQRHGHRPGKQAHRNPLLP